MQIDGLSGILMKEARGLAALVIGAVAIAMAPPQVRAQQPRPQQNVAPQKLDSSAARVDVGTLHHAHHPGHRNEPNSSSLDSRTRFFRDIELVRGHLFVGDELVKLGRWEEALPHFHHPLQQVYSAIGKRLQVHGVRQFDKALDELAAAVAARKPGEYASAWKLVEERIGEVDRSLGKLAERSFEWRIRTLIAVLQSTLRDYRRAVDASGSRIVDVVEYQDSRGFIFQAAAILDGMAPTLTKRDASAFNDMSLLLTKAKAAWPSPVPPGKPVLQVAEVSAYIAEIERLAIGMVPK